MTIFLTVVLCSTLCSAELTCGSAMSCGNDGGILYYPNIPSDCECIRGSLWIQQISDAHLVNVSNIQTITGTLVVLNNANLSDLSGFEQLSGIGALITSNNPALFSLSGLQSLNGNITEISLAGDDLQNISALSGVTGTDTLVIRERYLHSLQGLQNLRQIRGGLLIPHVQNDLDVFHNLQLLQGKLFLSLNNTVDLSAFADAHKGPLQLGIFESNALSSLTGLENAERFFDMLALVDNPVLVDTSALRGVPAELMYGGLQLQGLNISSLEDFNGIVNISDLQLCALPLTSFDGLDGMANVSVNSLQLWGLNVNSTDGLSFITRIAWRPGSDAVIVISGPLDGYINYQPNLRLQSFCSLCNALCATPEVALNFDSAIYNFAAPQSPFTGETARKDWIAAGAPCGVNHQTCSGCSLVK